MIRWFPGAILEAIIEVTSGPGDFARPKPCRDGDTLVGALWHSVWPGAIITNMLGRSRRHDFGLLFLALLLAFVGWRLGPRIRLRLDNTPTVPGLDRARFGTMMAEQYEIQRRKAMTKDDFRSILSKHGVSKEQYDEAMDRFGCPPELAARMKQDQLDKIGALDPWLLKRPRISQPGVKED